MRVARKRSVLREGVIAVELAVLLPFLMFVAAIGVDFARIFSRTVILETASRNGAIYASYEPAKSTDTAGIQAVVLKDCTDISPTPTVTSSTYTGTDGFSYVKVTVKYTFTTVMKFPGVPNSKVLSRTTDMRICPIYPKPGTY